MIYIISSIVKEESEYREITKIGYTDDLEWPRRLATYRLHNPGVEVLRVLPEWGRNYETRLHRHFKDLHWSGYGREWFYDPLGLILDFCKEDVDLDTLPQTELELARGIDEVSKCCRQMYRYISNVSDELLPSWIENTTTEILSAESDPWEYLGNIYGESWVLGAKSIELPSFDSMLESALSVPNTLPVKEIRRRIREIYITLGLSLSPAPNILEILGERYKVTETKVAGLKAYKLDRNE